jgi:queuosine precursor transporter
MRPDSALILRLCVVLKKMAATLSYMLLVVLINRFILVLPTVHWMGQAFSSADVLAGSIYLVRDFAQREIKHYVMLAMLLAGAISYALASPAVALASVSAFALGEFLDWGIFTFSGKPLSQRLVLSSLLASPLDSLVFLWLCGQLNWVGFLVMNVGKAFGVLVLWLAWKWKHRRASGALFSKEALG